MKVSRVISRIVVFTLAAILLLVGGITLFGDNVRKLFGASCVLSVRGPVRGIRALRHAQPQDDEELRGERGVRRGPCRASSSAQGARMKTASAQPLSWSRPALAAEPLPTGNTHTAERPNPFTLTSEDALSTFAVDVDTASYALFRRYVNGGSLPPREAVRVEEWAFPSSCRRPRGAGKAKIQRKLRPEKP